VNLYTDNINYTRKLKYISQPGTSGLLQQQFISSLCTNYSTQINYIDAMSGIAGAAEDRGNAFVNSSELLYLFTVSLITNSSSF
jgi:hypothetical protein